MEGLDIGGANQEKRDANKNLFEERQNNNIDLVFEMNPDLSEIGTKEQYKEYITTIFPKSEIEDILWHGSPNDKFEEFDDEKTGQLDGGFFGRGFYFTPSRQLAVSYQNRYNRGGKHRGDGSLYAVVLNLERPWLWKNNQKNFYHVDEVHLKDTPRGEILINNDFEEGFGKELLRRYNEKYQTSFESIDSDNFEYADARQRLGIVGTEILREEGYDGSIGKNPLSKLFEYTVFSTDQIHILGSQKDIQNFKAWVEK